MGQYRRLCSGLNNKGILIPAEDSVFKHITNLKKDHYLSLYLYSEEQKEKFYEEKEKLNAKTGKIEKSINGAKNINDVITDKLVFDFDDKHDLEKAQSDTIELINRLSEHGFKESEIVTTFSGNKGFGVEITTDQKFTPEEIKALTKNLAGDLETFDPVIFNASRIIRVPFTKHQDSGLYKTVLYPDDLTSSIEQIKELAKEEYEPELVGSVAKVPESILKLKIPPKKVKKEFNPENAADVDLKDRPKWLSNWKYAMQQGIFPEGSRNHSLMILAATYRGQSIPKVIAYRMLKGVAELQAQRSGQEEYESEKIWTEIIGQVYEDDWNGGTYAEDNFSDDLVEFLEENGIPRGDELEAGDSLVENIDDGFDGFVEYANRIDEYTMKFGIPSLDEKLKIRKGHLIFLLAPPGVGKTSFAITMLNNMSKEDTGCYFGSYDMYKNNVYQKLIQRHTGLEEEEIYDVFRNKDQVQIDKFRAILKKEYENVSFCFKVGQSIPDLKRSIAKEEERTGKPMELVVVDYLELVLTDAKDPTAASAEAAQGLREIANEGRVVVGLLQPNKMSSTPDEPILSYNGAKGSSTIAQSGTAILTAHRPGISSENNNENDEYFAINCVKNRNGPLFALDFGWKGNTQTIYEMEDAQKAELKKLRRMKAENKAIGDL